MNTRGNSKASLLLLLTAVIWGTAFVAQSVGMVIIQPFTFTSIRFFISGLVLLPAIAVLDRALPERRALKQARRPFARGAAGRAPHLAFERRVLRGVPVRRHLFAAVRHCPGRRFRRRQQVRLYYSLLHRHRAGAGAVL